MDERLSAYFEMAALSDSEFVERAFCTVLRRPPDEEARRYSADALGSHGLSRAALLAELVGSQEFKRLRILEDALGEATAWRLKSERPVHLSAPADFDPRPVEYIWTLSRYRDEPRVLDVGYANADPVWLTTIATMRPAELIGVDLFELEVPGIKSVVADVRELPFPNSSFDVIFCISTIEHIGADNTRYGDTATSQEGGPLGALRELRRVTAQEGRVLLTVPCGDIVEEWSVRQPASIWRSWFGEAGFGIVESELYVERDGLWASGDGETGVLCVELAL